MTEEGVQRECKCERAERVAEHDLVSDVSLSELGRSRRTVETCLSTARPPDKAGVGRVTRPGIDTVCDELVRRQFLDGNTRVVQGIPSVRCGTEDNH